MKNKNIFLKQGIPLLLSAAILLSGCGVSSGDTVSVGSGSTQNSPASETMEDSGSTVSVSGGETVSAVSSSEDTGISSSESTSAKAAEAETTLQTVSDPDSAPKIDGLTYTGTMALQYATCFNVYYYEGGYKLISVPKSGDYLLVPDGKEAPKGLSDDITVIGQPQNIYLAATSAMSLFCALDSLNVITMCGIKADDWTIDAARKAMEDGSIIFAGKYNEPDYETMVEKNCDLAIESTMILHNPEVQEMIENIGIPVFIDRSSYESEALGRTEWIKLYGAMVNKEDEAFAHFAEQTKVISDLEGEKNTGKTVAFFSVGTDGTVTVRSGNDYIANMIKEGGGDYIFADLDTGEDSSVSVSLSMEEFYNKANQADYLIYNGAIENGLGSVQDLIDKSNTFADFKAVRDGNVWQVGKSMYQATDTVGQFITDVHLMLTGGDESKMTFLSRVAS
ncbi:ABC transporter substrate-binding protein [Bilifractor sp. LCP21S3_A7]|uniref:ABC transporter substrate-binding protein n=1 Tax=Bilifractor sp. LCP21S3_A7 TaxID=3438738 RepID=UPI003F8DB2FA